MLKACLFTALAALMCSNAIAQDGGEVSWRKAMSAVEEKIENLGARQTEFVSIGTMYNEIDVNLHSCSVIARMIGKYELLPILEVSYDDAAIARYDGSVGVSDQDLGIAQNSLYNWLASVERLLAATPAERVREWNLDCVGRFGVPISHYVGEQNKETFYSIENQGMVLRVLGNVEAGFARKLDDALDNAPSVKTVALGSEGGSVREGILAAISIRKKGLNTVLWNECLSACTLVFLGGIERNVYAPYPRLGFHMVSQDGEAVALDDPVYALIAEFVQAMGARPGYVLRAMAQAAPSEMYYPDGDYLCAGSIISYMQRRHHDC